MQFANFDEFWAALGQLYDETLEIKESIRAAERQSEKDREIARTQGESIGVLAEATQRLLSVVEKQHEVVSMHERRTEVTVEAILEDLRRHREQRPSQ